MMESPEDTASGGATPDATSCFRSEQVGNESEYLAHANPSYVSILVGGLRISTGPTSTTPGPRSHLLGLKEGFKELEIPFDITLASDMPGLSRYAKLKEENYRRSPAWKVAIADLARLATALYCGITLSIKSIKKRPTFIYERAAVFQMLTLFHLGQSTAVKIVESNGIMSRETARDRGGIYFEKLAGWLETILYRRADLIVAVSEDLAAEVEAFADIDRSKIVVVPNGVTSSVFRYHKHIDRDITRTIRIGFSGSIVEWQRIDRMIEAFLRLRETTVATFQIIGDGPILQELKEKANASDLGGAIEFTGRLSHSEALSMMANWDIGIAGHTRSSSARMYHSPLKLYEYAGLGNIIVCTPSQDAESLEASGVPVFLYNDTDQLYDSIVSATETLASYTDQRETVRKRLRREHSWRRRVEEIVNAATKADTSKGTRSTRPVRGRARRFPYPRT